MVDKDLLSADDMIGEATLDLNQWFRRVYRRSQKLPSYWDAEGDSKANIPHPLRLLLEKPCCGSSNKHALRTLHYSHMHEARVQHMHTSIIRSNLRWGG